MTDQIKLTFKPEYITSLSSRASRKSVITSSDCPAMQCKHHGSFVRVFTAAHGLGVNLCGVHRRCAVRACSFVVQPGGRLRGRRAHLNRMQALRWRGCGHAAMWRQPGSSASKLVLTERVRHCARHVLILSHFMQATYDHCITVCLSQLVTSRCPHPLFVHQEGGA